MFNMMTPVMTTSNPEGGTLTISTTEMNVVGVDNDDMSGDDLSDPSSPESSFDTSDLLGPDGIHDEVTVQLASSGTVGMAAAAAIASGKKRKRPHVFETNPSIRKRQQTRLLRKLKTCIEEYTTRVGQQAVVLCCTPGKVQHNNNFKVFGSQPLENVMRNCKSVLLTDLECTLTEQLPQNHDSNRMHELPPLSIDGIPTSVDKMTQAQLRTFIPEMLKFSTNRSKPGWGKAEFRPEWWPDSVPWANVRSDVRTPQQKKEVSWTEALRTIVINCYKHHGREDLLRVFEGADQSPTPQSRTMFQTINNPDGTFSLIQIETAPNQVVTLPDGTQATVVHTIHDGVPLHEANQAVKTLADVASNQREVGNLQLTPVSVEVNNDTVRHNIATINEEGHIVLTGDDLGTTSGIVIPVSVYQPLAQSNVSFANLQSQGDNIHVAMAPIAMGTKSDVEDTSPSDQGDLSNQNDVMETGDDDIKMEDP